MASEIKAWLQTHFVDLSKKTNTTTINDTNYYVNGSRSTVSTADQPRLWDTSNEFAELRNPKVTQRSFERRPGNAIN